MKKIILIFLLLLILPTIFADVKVYKIWSLYDTPNSPIIHIDISEQVIYLGIVNRDDYAHNVIVEADCNGHIWKSGLITLPPNSHIEKIVEVRVPVYDDKEHNVNIKLIENGKTISSTTVRVKSYFPVDVKNVTCEDSYKEDNSEVCYSNWFNVILKSNPIAQSDYIAKVWINLKDGNKILYDGINDTKTVYIPYRKEVKISFKVPKIVLNKDKFTIETNVEIMNVTHTIDGIEELSEKRSNNVIFYEYKTNVKYFNLPIIIKNVELYRKIDENTSNIVKEFYDSAGILDDEIYKILSDKYLQQKNNDVIPRYYVEGDPILSILKITVENKYNKDILARLFINYGNIIVKNIKLNKTKDNILYIPIYTTKGTKNIEVKIYPIDADKLIFEKNYSVNINPIPVAPVIIENVILPKDDNINTDTNIGGDVLVGKKYNMTIILKNIYNKTLYGKITIDDNFPKGVANYTKTINFSIYPHTTKKINVPIIFYREINGDLKITVSVDGGAKDSTSLAHFCAVLPIDIIRVYYNNTLLLGKINTINKNGGIYINKPIAGFNNTCVVELRNKLNKDIVCDVWVEVIDENGTIKAKSNCKTVTLKKLSTTEISFPIFFDEGFEGYTIAHIIPKSLENVDITYTEGYGIHPVPISNYYEIGRYSAIDLLGNKVATGTHVVTEVISPVNIENISYNDSILIAKIRNDKFPVNLTIQYWAVIENNSKIYYKSPTYQEEIYPKSEKSLKIPIDTKTLKFGRYNVTLYIKIDDFALYNNKKVPIILQKSVSLTNNKNILNGHHNNLKEQYNITSKNKSDIINTKGNSTEISRKNAINRTKKTSEHKNILSNFSEFLEGIVSTIIGIFR
ncbi:conserved protein of unknown function [Methanocaldococcus lauensis]|uniref:Uncharacterized protein n=1 Tax=Methanocaldococcus lauensis TaxID=2546128 RepID=A0A8D6PYQ1_9EURY|nr:hypothetical protein [Methanocaldococcus lauensis]CAB3289794.1 conserved protein of unknown function [Methanocaldococcus lauensis]